MQGGKVYSRVPIQLFSGFLHKVMSRVHMSCNAKGNLMSSGLACWFRGLASQPGLCSFGLDILYTCYQ